MLEGLLAPVCKVETLGLHLGADAAALDLEDQPAKGGVSEVEVPHVLERGLVHLAGAGGGIGRGAAKGVAAVGIGGHLFDKG